MKRKPQTEIKAPKPGLEAEVHRKRISQVAPKMVYLAGLPSAQWLLELLLY